MLIVWIILFVVSIAIPVATEKTGDGFTRGINRVTIFFGWQITAFVVSLIVFFMAKRTVALSKSWRVAAKAPLFMHCLIVVIIAVLIIYTVVSSPAM